MFYRSLHHKPIDKPYKNFFQSINRTLYYTPMFQSGPPMPPQLPLVLLGGALFFYVFIRKL